MSLFKYRYIVAVFIIGFVTELFGFLQKIIHASNADKLLTIDFYIMAMSGITAVIKLIFSKNKNSFLDK